MVRSTRSAAAAPAAAAPPAPPAAASTTRKRGLQAAPSPTSSTTAFVASHPGSSPRKAEGGQEEPKKKAKLARSGVSLSNLERLMEPGLTETRRARLAPRPDPANHSTAAPLLEIENHEDGEVFVMWVGALLDWRRD